MELDEIVDCENVGTVAIWETLGVQPPKLSEGELFHINGESSGDKKGWGYPRRKDAGKKLRIKGTHGVS